MGEKGAWAHQGTAVIFSVPPIILRTGKGTNFKFGTRIHRVHANKSPLKIKERRERGRIRGLPKFFEYPLLSQKGVKLRKFGRYIHGVHANKSPLKIGKKRARGRIWGSAKIFSVTPIISGKGKATNFQFCAHVLSIDRYKSPLKISEKVAVC